MLIVDPPATAGGTDIDPSPTAESWDKAAC